jgi:major intracellular serine protease
MPNLFPYITQDIPKMLGVPWNISQVNAPSFWPHTKGAGAIIAVVDTGLDISHPEFAGRIVGAWNFNGGAWNDLADKDGHGTHVAGIAAGKTCGVAPEARIMPLKVFGGPIDTGEAIKEAFRYIYKWNTEHSETDRVVAVNCSFGSGAYDIEQAYLIRRLVGAGVTVCVAAGNQGDGKPDTEEVFMFPGYIWECLTTGALNQDGQSAGYSSSYDGIDVAAPGTQIYSAWPGGGYKLLSGTSMATPHITGAMALIYSAWSKKKGEWPTEDQAFDVLLKHIRKVGADHRFVGNGVLDLTWDDDKWPVEEIVLTLNSNVIFVDGEERAVEQAPVAMVGSNRSVIPVHGIFEPFGISVGWVEKAKQVILRKGE